MIRGKNILFVEQDRIEAFDATGRMFFRDILDMDWDGILVTDLSSLSDFSSCGLPDDTEVGTTLADLYRAWDAWVIPRIEATFGVKVEKTTVLLVDLFARIEQAKVTFTRH